MPANAAPDAPLAWAKTDLTVSGYQGTTIDAAVDFTYSGSITNPSVKVSGRFADTVTVDLAQAQPTTAGHASATIHVELPPKQADSYVDNLQFMVDGKPLPQPLHLTVSPQAVDPNVIPTSTGFPSASRITTLDGGGVAVTDQLVVVISGDNAAPDQTIKSLAAKIGGQVVGSVSSLRRYEVRIPGSAFAATTALLPQVKAYPGVASATIDALAQTSAYTNDDVWRPSPGAQINENWNLQQINAPSAWDISTANGVDVAEIDSGVYRSHMDLSGNIKHDEEVTGSAIKHGTHTSGTFCAEGNNFTGTVGVAYGCNLSMYGVYTTAKGNYMNPGDVLNRVQQINALPAAKADGTTEPGVTSPKVVNVSIGYETTFDCTTNRLTIGQINQLAFEGELHASMATLVKERPDILWVFSAGNSGRDSSCSAWGDLGNEPSLPNVITVAASDPSGNMPVYSVRGKGVTVAAPGGGPVDAFNVSQPGSGVYSTLPPDCSMQWLTGRCDTNNYGYLAGTSMAAPAASGVAALAFGAAPSLTASDVKACVEIGALQGGKQIAGQTGLYIVDARKAVDCALESVKLAHHPLTNVQSVIPSRSANFALKKDGTVWAWGNNDSGQLGNGTNDTAVTPTQVVGLSNVASVYNSGGTGYALKKDGTLWAWGDNSSGSLGIGTRSNVNTPVQVPGLPPITSVSTLSGTVFAAGNDGSAWAWGNNWLGQAGTGSSSNVLSPTRLAIPDAVASVYAGGYTGYALTTKGTAWSWGDNGQGQLGNGTTTPSSTPVQVSGLTGASKLITTQGSVVYALMPDKTLQVWGEGSGGALGNGTYDKSLVPIPVPGIAGVAQVEANPGHTFVRLASGKVLAFGSGWDGALGTGTTDNTATPTPVNGIGTATGVASAGRSSMALLADGTVRAWGMGLFGFLGTASTVESNPTPVTVSGLTGAVSIVAGEDAAYAVKADGTVWSWGLNSSGQLGRATDSYFDPKPGQL